MMKKLNYYLKKLSISHSAGSSLIEVMMASGISIIIALGVAQMMKNSDKAANATKARVEITNELNLKLDKLSSSDFCSLAFKDAKVKNDSIEEIKYETTDRNGVPVNVVLFKKNELYFNKFYRLIAISSNFDPNDPHNMRLVLQFEKVENKELFLANIFNQTINISIVTSGTGDDAIVESCFAHDLNILDSITQNICHGPGAAYDVATGKCIIFGQTSDLCPSGKHLKRYKFNVTDMLYEPECSQYVWSVGYWNQNQNSAIASLRFRCPDGQVAYGINSLGRPLCRAEKAPPVCTTNQVLSTDASGNYICTSVSIDYAKTVVNDGSNCGLNLVSGKIKFECSGCTPTSPNTCGQLNLNYCYYQAVPNDSCGGTCGPGVKNANCCITGKTCLVNADCDNGVGGVCDFVDTSGVCDHSPDCTDIPQSACVMLPSDCSWTGTECVNRTPVCVGSTPAQCATAGPGCYWIQNNTQKVCSNCP